MISQQESIREALISCRTRTLSLVEGIDKDTFCNQAHPNFSPVGWHLGHIAYTEYHWILKYFAELPPLFPYYHKLFSADGLPKHQREKLPSWEFIHEYLRIVREKALAYLEQAPIDNQARLWRWLVQHECQHSETISIVLQLHNLKKGKFPPLPSCLTELPSPEMVKIPAGYFSMGNDTIYAQDNEKPTHQVYLDTYSLDRYPVTCGEYKKFMAAGGYDNPRWWSKVGWQWLQNTQEPITQPLYWKADDRWDSYPVYGVSWYEAEAYAKFAGKRLPTEAEWEKAANFEEINLHHCNHNNLVGATTPVNAYENGQSIYGCYDLLGNVWEWTNTWFDGYQGFEYYPYTGYSQVYFDGQHRVLRGGSWATRPWALRPSFRNWYYPHMRQIFAGFRCAV